MDGNEFGSPSAAACSVTQNSVNGWMFWEYFDEDLNEWKILDRLRSKNGIKDHLPRSSRKHSFKDAAIMVLQEAKKPLHYRDIAQTAIQRGYVSTVGRTPDVTMSAILSQDIKRSFTVFEKVAPGIYALKEG